MTRTPGLVASETSSPFGQLMTIAEISGNHLSDKKRAIELIHAAKAADATFVKFQHYRPETITTKSSHSDFRITPPSIWAGRSLWALYAEAMTPWEWTEELVGTCEEVGISWFSSPFDETAVEFLEDFNPPMYKVASFEIIDIPLIERIAQTGRPIIFSTGMATEEEIFEAVAAAKNAGNEDLALLRTNSAYPAAVSEMDLAAIPYMAEKFGLPVGLSDHTLDNTSAIVASALGARVFEKHLTLKRSDGGPDAAFSLEPEEFADYVKKIGEAHLSLGTPRFGPSEREQGSVRLRPSIRAVKDIGPGELLTSENTATIRPAGGLHPRFIPEVMGRVSKGSLRCGDPLTWESIEGI